MHLVDTSVLTRLNQPAVRTAVEHLPDSGRLGRAGWGLPALVRVEPQ